MNAQTTSGGAPAKAAPAEAAPAKAAPDFEPADFLKTLTHQPGVYRMLGGDGAPLYIGKAANLKKRVSAYFRGHGLSAKTRLLMERTAAVEVTVTRSEAEALLLENNLIKKHRPRYNVLLRDDKSYPWIRLTNNDAFPRIEFYRGSRKAPGRYFGPYPNAAAVRQTLNLLQKLFQLRQCDDAFFSNRARPCLQYQIKRCSAPCVGYIGEDDYRADLALATEFLSGNGGGVIETLAARMDRAARELRYEDAVRYRDQVSTLRQVSAQRAVSGDGGDSDVIACHLHGGFACVQVFNIRAGMNIGNKAFHPKLPDDEMDEAALLTAFAGQYYLAHDIPGEIIFSGPPGDAAALNAMLSDKAGRKVALTTAPRGRKRRCLAIARSNAEIALKAKLSSRAGMRKRLHALQEALDLPRLPARMECFDISHTAGEKPVAACVVFNQDGALRQDYRRFNIAGVTAGDDYAALRQAIERRYRRLKRGEAQLPDVLFIDGGKGQVSQARAALHELGVGGVEVIGVAKGAGRKAGLETLIVGDFGETMRLRHDSAALHLIQQVRDEAHRFAVAGHRHRRGKARKRSPLEDIRGLGPVRRRQLLRHFGGAQGVRRADVEELGQAPGISRRLAEDIYHSLHSE
ncbi:MAG: excinuclease ABC subunit UvrC [Gammaproteobacteria bacterium]|nr:excinuclease ABC subunit UvrC [Gammaproteobacteria bacterium]